MCVRPILVSLLIAGGISYGQVSVRTKTFSFGKPVLSVKAEFLGEKGTAWLNAKETGTLTLTITNAGTATAHAAGAMLNASAPLKDLQFEAKHPLGDIKPGEKRVEKIAISAPEDAPSEKGIVAVNVKAEPGTIKVDASVEISVRGIPAPRLVVEIPTSSAGIAAGENPTVNVQVINAGSGAANVVSASVASLRSGVEVTFGGLAKDISLGAIEPGSTRELPLDLKTGGGGVTGAIPFIIRLEEERPIYSVAETLSVTVKSPDAEKIAFAAFKRGDYMEAIRAFELVAATGKASKEVYFSLGVSYYRNMNGPKCLTNMQCASRLGSDQAKNWIMENTYPLVNTTVSYTARDSSPFEGYASPVGLGMLPFLDSLGHETSVSAKLYRALKAMNESFKIFPYSTIKVQGASWGQAALSPANKQILIELDKELSVNFAVTGTTEDSTGSAISLQLIRCKDGAVVASQEFRTSLSSTALNDAALFLVKGKVPVYGKRQTLEVKLQ